MTELADFSDSDLLSELRWRGYVMSVWSAEDGEGPVEEKFPDAEEGRKKALCAALLDLAGKGLEDILAERGNEHLSDFMAYSTQEVADAADKIEADEAEEAAPPAPGA